MRLHFTPTYSSWLNQVELWFAKIERDVIARGVFTSVPDLARKLRRYLNAYSANAQFAGNTQTSPAASVVTIWLRQATSRSRTWKNKIGTTPTSAAFPHASKVS